MLYFYDTLVTTIPHRDRYGHLIDQLPWDAFYQAFLSKVEDKKLVISNFLLKRKDWTTYPINSLNSVCNGNIRLASSVYGVLLWKFFIESPDCWRGKKWDKNGVKGKIYRKE